MNKDLFFGGRKIVDIWIGHRWSMVMDEDGELWSGVIILEVILDILQTVDLEILIDHISSENQR